MLKCITATCSNKKYIENVFWLRLIDVWKLKCHFWGFDPASASQLKTRSCKMISTRVIVICWLNQILSVCLLYFFHGLFLNIIYFCQLANRRMLLHKLKVGFLERWNVRNVWNYVLLFNQSSIDKLTFVHQDWFNIRVKKPKFGPD